MDKVKPFAFIGDPPQQYHAVGEFQGKAFSIGLEIKSRGKPG